MLKYIFLFLSLLHLPLPQACASDFFSIQLEGTIDTSNLFKSDQKVNFRDYGVPTELAHPYLVRVEYTIPKGLTAHAVYNTIPEHQDCGEWSCDTVSTHVESLLEFGNKKMTVSWTLIDPLRKMIVGRVTEPMIFRIFKSSEHSAAFNRFESVTKINRHLPDVETNNGHIQFKLAPQSFPNRMIVSFQEIYAFNYDVFEGVKLEIESLGTDQYRLKKAILQPGKLSKIYHTQGAQLDADWNRLKFYLSVGSSSDASYPSFIEKVIATTGF